MSEKFTSGTKNSKQTNKYSKPFNFWWLTGFCIIIKRHYAEHRSSGVYGRGDESTLILLDGVQCNGNEGSIAACSHGDYGRHDCSHSEDVGVICREYNVFFKNISTDNKKIIKFRIKSIHYEQKIQAQIDVFAKCVYNIKIFKFKFVHSLITEVA